MNIKQIVGCFADIKGNSNPIVVMYAKINMYDVFTYYIKDNSNNLQNVLNLRLLSTHPNEISH